MNDKKNERHSFIENAIGDKLKSSYNNTQGKKNNFSIET